MNQEEREEEIERIASEVLNNMSIATALSILIEKSKEIAKDYLDTASKEEVPHKNAEGTPVDGEREEGFLSKIKKIFK